VLGENIGECHTCIIGNWAAVGSDGYVEEKGSNNTSRALDELKGCKSRRFEGFLFLEIY
jgi:hypothetical protein